MSLGWFVAMLISVLIQTGLPLNIYVNFVPWHCMGLPTKI